MSNSLAIAAVTMTLQGLLDDGFSGSVGLSGTQVTVRPPERARDSVMGGQVNIFLFQTNINAALRNQDLPQRTRAGELGFPALPLDLLFLLTAYSANDSEVLAHQILGRAMSILHDNPILTPQQIRDATMATMPESDLHEQIEHVRIIPQSISLEDMSRLWSTFQVQYRLSVIYHIGVILIDSARRSRAALPVLRRGEDDRGAAVQSDTIPPFPTLAELLIPERATAPRLGDVLTLRGHHLDGANPTLIFTNPRLDLVNEVPPLAGGTPNELRVRLPKPPGLVPDPDDDPAAADDWASGPMTITLRVTREGRERTSNALPLLLAPRVTLAADAIRLDGDRVFVRMLCVPSVWPGQRVALLIGDREVPFERVTAKRADLEFEVTGLPPGDYVVRVRVDGVDSIPFVSEGVPPRLAFAGDQRVTIP